MKNSGLKSNKFPKTLGTKINSVIYRKFQEEAEKRGISESQLLRTILAEIMALYKEGLLVIPKSDTHSKTEYSRTLGTKVPMSTYLVFCKITRATKITQSDLLRFGIATHLQIDISTVHSNAKSLNSIITSQINSTPRSNSVHQRIPEITFSLGINPYKKKPSKNWIEQMQNKSAENFLHVLQVRQFVGALALVLFMKPKTL